MSEKAATLIDAFDDAVVLTAMTDVMDRAEFKAAHDKWSVSRAALLAYIERIERELEEARANYAFMVDRAAQREPTLDGYRELGAKCAQLEQKLDEARAENARLRPNAERYEWLKAHAEDYDGHVTFPDVRYRNGLQDGFEARTVDEAIDAARKP